MSRLGIWMRLTAALAVGALIGGCTSSAGTPEREPVWTVALPHHPGAVDIAADHVVVASDSSVVSLNPATGEVAWTRSPLETANDLRTVGSELKILPERTAIAGDRVVVAMTGTDSRDQVYEILDLSSGTPAWRYEFNSAGGEVLVTQRSLLAVLCTDLRGPCRIAARDVATGADQWSRQFEGGARIVGTFRRHHVGAFAVPAAPPAIPVLHLPSDPAERTRVTGLDPRSGRPLMTVTTPFRGNPQGLRAGRDNVVHTDGALVLSDSHRDDGCRSQLRGFDLETGEPRWRTTVGTYQSGDLTGGPDSEECGDNVATDGTLIGSGTLLAGTDVEGAPQLLDLAEGTPRWTGKPGGRIVDTDGSRVVVRQGAESGQLLVRDLGSGRSWTLPNPDPDSSLLESLDVVVTDGQMIVSRPSGEDGTGDELVGHDAASGRELWTASDGGEILAAGPGWVICWNSAAAAGPGQLRLFRVRASP